MKNETKLTVNLKANYCFYLPPLKWLIYCRYGVIHQSNNQSINQSINPLEKNYPEYFDHE